MRLSRIENVTPGERLGESLYGADGRLLLAEGVALTASYLRAIRDLGIPAIYLRDADTADVKVPHAISPVARARIAVNLANAFRTVSQSMQRFCPAIDSQRAGEVHQHLRSQRFGDVVKAVADSGSVPRLVADVDQLLDGLMSQDVIVGMNSIKSHDDYTFQHSIDVTIMSLLLARRLGWNAERLKAFGAGCILHDIGKIVIDPEILNKPGRLTDDEFEQMKSHPTVGHDLIRATAPALGYLVPQVAYQHHERQDGSGYPRGLHGNNRLGCNAPNMIHDFGAVSAVADVYDAMSSDRPYRRCWPTDRVVKLISESAQTHLNSEVVGFFRAIVAPYPVCSEIRVINGAHAGYRGIVVHVDGAELDRPRVRLLHDASGKRIDAIEIDLRTLRDVNIEGAQEAIPQVSSRGASIPKSNEVASPAQRAASAELLRRGNAA